jgi:Arc/MetJ family transcription regulator
MRTNIVIDQRLMSEAMRLTGLPTKKAVVEEALHTLIRLKKQQGILELHGKVRWEGNLDEMREGRVTHDDNC